MRPPCFRPTAKASKNRTNGTKGDDVLSSTAGSLNVIAGNYGDDVSIKGLILFFFSAILIYYKLKLTPKNVLKTIADVNKMLVNSYSTQTILDNTINLPV